MNQKKMFSFATLCKKLLSLFFKKNVPLAKSSELERSSIPVIITHEVRQSKKNFKLQPEARDVANMIDLSAYNTK